MPKNTSQASARVLRGNSSRNGRKDQEGGTERVETRSVAVLHAPISSSPHSIVLPDTPTESDTALSAVQEQIRQLQEELISEKRNREEDKKKLALLEQRVEGLGEDTDDKGDGGGRARKRRKKAGRKSTRRLILMKKGAELTSAEKQTKKRLRNAIIYELHEQSGIKNKKNATLPSPENAGEQVVDGKKILVPDLSESVEHFANGLLIEQAVHIVDNDQEKSETRVVTDDTVQYSRDDLRELAKAQLRKWRRQFKINTNPNEKKKHDLRNLRNTRRQRRSQLKEDRLKVVKAYKRKFGASPTCLLETDYMSEYVSQKDDGNEQEKEDYKKKLQQAARLTEAQIRAKVPVWERRQPLFRSSELNKVYEELDKLVEERLAKKKKTHIRVPRVCFNDVFVDVPPVKTYPFMIDEMWYEDHVHDTSFEAQLQHYARDPAGFGSRKDEIVLTNLNEAAPDSDAHTSSDDSSDTDGSEA
ncbi:hypothetical protein ACEPAG_9043 [Sanghuangporus baumii]